MTFHLFKPVDNMLDSSDHFDLPEVLFIDIEKYVCDDEEQDDNGFQSIPVAVGRGQSRGQHQQEEGQQTQNQR